jgi:hypothetical protein
MVGPAGNGHTKEFCFIFLANEVVFLTVGGIYISQRMVDTHRRSVLRKW